MPETLDWIVAYASLLPQPFVVGKKEDWTGLQAVRDRVVEQATRRSCPVGSTAVHLVEAAVVVVVVVAARRYGLCLIESVTKARKGMRCWRKKTAVVRPQ